MMIRSSLFVSLGVVMAIGISLLRSQELPGVIPESGVVPNAETAVKIAEAVLIPVYGKKRIASEEPFHAKLKNGEWHVTGTLPVRLNPALAAWLMSQSRS